MRKEVVKRTRVRRERRRGIVFGEKEERRKKREERRKKKEERRKKKEERRKKKEERKE